MIEQLAEQGKVIPNVHHIPAVHRSIQVSNPTLTNALDLSVAGFDIEVFKVHEEYIFFRIVCQLVLNRNRKNPDRAFLDGHFLIRLS